MCVKGLPIDRKWVMLHALLRKNEQFFDDVVGAGCLLGDRKAIKQLSDNDLSAKVRYIGQHHLWQEKIDPYIQFLDLLKEATGESEATEKLVTAKSKDELCDQLNQCLANLVYDKLIWRTLLSYTCDKKIPVIILALCHFIIDKKILLKKRSKILSH